MITNITEKVRMMKKMEILLVEDNADDAELTSLIFEKTCNIPKNKIHVSKDGVEALEYIFGFADENINGHTPLKRHPNLIVLDLKLPKIDGLEILKTIKSHPETKNVPVIVLTGSNDWMDWTNAHSFDVAYYIDKPPKSCQIVDIIKFVNVGVTMQGFDHERRMLCTPFYPLGVSKKEDDKK